MKPRRILNRWDMILTDQQADWDTWEYWERCRFEDMAARMPATGLFFDIGTEFGSITATIAKHIVGDGSRFVLFEPSPEFWPNIRATWDANGLAEPRDAVMALVGDRVANCELVRPREAFVWPPVDGPITETLDYRYLHNNHAAIPVVTIDAYASATDDHPTVLNVDVEGAELSVLSGATRTLAIYRPVVWVSIHPDLMERSYDVTPDDLMRFMHRHDYVGHHLGTDHEEHWRFDPDTR